MAKLLVGGDGGSQQPIVVPRTVMSLASPVFKAMFDRFCIESEATEISLPDDDPGAMLIVLKIAHLRFHDLPKAADVDIEALLCFAVTCENHDLVTLIRPFLDLHGWAQKHFPNVATLKNCDPSWLS